MDTARDPRIRNREEKMRRSQMWNLNELSAGKGRAIAGAAQEVLNGRWDVEFPRVVFQNRVRHPFEHERQRSDRQSGGATSRGQVHPNEDVNRCQSSNDVFPSVMHIASVERIEANLIPAVDGLRETLAAKSKSFPNIVMIGRTHLQDATPISLRAGHLGLDVSTRPRSRGSSRRYPWPLRTGARRDSGRHGTQRASRVWRIGHSQDRGRERSGICSSAEQVCCPLGPRRGCRSQRKPTHTCRVMEIANDVRWYASGPRAGIGGLKIPEY